MNIGETYMAKAWCLHYHREREYGRHFSTYLLLIDMLGSSSYSLAFFLGLCRNLLAGPAPGLRNHVDRVGVPGEKAH